VYGSTDWARVDRSLAKQFCGWARAAKRFQGAMGKKLGRTANRVEQACEQGVQLVQYEYEYGHT
jgi:hypothetical protein